MNPIKLKSINVKGGYRIELSENRNNNPVAKLLKLLSSGPNKGQYKQIEGFYFKDENRRKEYVEKKVNDIIQRYNEKQKELDLKKQVRDNMNHGFEVGQVYYDSWGYEQTNIDFYQVIEVKGKSVVIQSIGGEMVEGTHGHDCANVRPVKDSFVGEPMKKNVQFYIDRQGKPVFYIKSRHGWISLYDQGDRGVYSSWGY